ncbi:MAG: GTP 3',8-cyclase MoaA [Acidimicrobiia bacterium]
MSNEARIPGPPTATGELVDTFGRVADDLRISVTDRCNLRCMYCMPADGLPWLPRKELLTFEEITRLARIFVGLGVRTIRITGGEPLVRHGLVDLVGMLAEVDPRPELALTTNGVLLSEWAGPLASAGLDRVNVSVDSLRPDRNLEITRRPDLERTLAGLEAACDAGLTPVKVNCVVIRGTNDDEIADFATWAEEHGYQVRFIEYMPLDADGRWVEGDVFTAEEMLETLGEAGFRPRRRDVAERDPAARYSLGDDGEVGIIPSVSAPFCSSCNRLRITAEGALRTCLFALDETDLRGPLRAGAEAGEIEALVRKAVWGKWEGHHIGRSDFERPDKSMSQIGG